MSDAAPEWLSSFRRRLRCHPDATPSVARRSGGPAFHADVYCHLPDRSARLAFARPPTRPEVMRLRIALIAACAAPVAPAAAQTTPLSRTEAVQTALDRGARIGVAGADVAVARAQLITARALPNPALSASYSKS